MTAQELAGKLRDKFGSRVLSEPREFRGETTLTLLDASRLMEVAAFAKAELGFDYLVDISSVDNHGEEPRFEVVYELYSYAHRSHLRLKTCVPEDNCSLQTLSNTWRTANWHEREIYDMMGIRFEGHPDLRRILMWEGYPHHPLRKDFPLEGRPTDVPGVAFTRTAPMEGGPFATTPGLKHATEREPKAQPPDAASNSAAAPLPAPAEPRH